MLLQKLGDGAVAYLVLLCAKDRGEIIRHGREFGFEKARGSCIEG